MWLPTLMLLLLSVSHGKPSPSLPDFGSVYHVKGVISLPYAEIVEPFEAWYDQKSGVSRIDYYHGQVSTYQVATEKPWGSSYTITPQTSETETNVMKCFRLNGTARGRVRAQAALPAVDAFQFLRVEYRGGHLCEVWQNVTTEGRKKNTYTLWATRGADGQVTPWHYEMMGYNTLLGSHYDKYLLDYSRFSRDVDHAVFSLPEGMTCASFPGPGAELHLLANPMQDLVRTSPAGHAHQVFNHFKEKFERRYGDEVEHEDRERVFVHNLRWVLSGNPNVWHGLGSRSHWCAVINRVKWSARHGQVADEPLACSYIHSKNREGLSYRLALNHLSDRSHAELVLLRGRKRSKTPNGGLAFPSALPGAVTVPDSLDWRLYGAVTPVKDQAICGSCWSFATTGALEGALFLKTGTLARLSQQMLIDCTWGFGNDGCDGGEEWRAYEWMMKHGGIATAERYGAYMGMNGFCHYNQSELVAAVRSYTNVTSGDTTALKVALWKRGPVAVSIDASHRSFSFYSSGVYYEPACGNRTEDLDHAVLAVGYGVLDGEPYWLVKNSWSTYWGNAGYVLMSMKDNNCGVATDATYVTLV